MEKERRYSFSCDRFLSGAKNHPLTKAVVHHDQERIKPGGGRKIRDEVAGDLAEGKGGRGGNRGRGGEKGMGVRFILLADGAASDVGADVGGKTRPPEVRGDELTGFKETGVTRSRVIMATTEDETSKVVVGWYINAALVGEDAVNVLPIR